MIKISRNWFFIFIISAFIIVALYFNFNSAKKIYVKGDNYYVGKLIDYLNLNGYKFKIVDVKKANVVIDLDNLEVSLYNGMHFNIKYSEKLINKVISLIENRNCKVLSKNDDFYLKNQYFYKHFTFETSCGINIMILPEMYENVEKLVFRTILNILKGNYQGFENEYFVNKMYIYRLYDNWELIATYEPTLEILELIADEKN